MSYAIKTMVKLKLAGNKLNLKHCALARLHLLHKTCRVDLTPGSADWTVRLNIYTVNVVPARIIQLLDWGESTPLFKVVNLANLAICLHVVLTNLKQLF